MKEYLYLIASNEIFSIINDDEIIFVSEFKKFMTPECSNVNVEMSPLPN